MNLLATAGQSLGSLDPIEQLLKLKILLPEALGHVTETSVAEAAWLLVSDLLGSARGEPGCTVIRSPGLPAGVLMEAEAIMRVRAGAVG